MANVDLTTGKISGAEKDSKTYYHEEAHLKFEDECRNGNKIRTIQDISLKGVIFGSAIGVVMPLMIIKVFILISILGYSLSNIYEERWCWNYASKKIGEKKESDERITQNKV